MLHAYAWFCFIQSVLQQHNDEGVFCEKDTWLNCNCYTKQVLGRGKVKSRSVQRAQMHPLFCYLLCLWVQCRSSYSCWFVNCLSPTRCHLSVVPQSPSHVGRPACRLPTSLTCSNRPHLRHTPPDPSGINSFSLNFCAAITASQSVLCQKTEREGVTGRDGEGGWERSQRKHRKRAERSRDGDGWRQRSNGMALAVITSFCFVLLKHVLIFIHFCVYSKPNKYGIFES